MKNLEKVNQLRSIIENKISPLITNDYVLWGLPYYSNIGDTLIWEGELEFLKSIPYKCIGTCGWDEYECKPLSKDTVILITGGGYFGDVWRKAWDSVMNTIECYPDNPIVILPNTIFYNDAEVMRLDAARMARLRKLTICVRDETSLKIAREHFNNPALLVPDMAFCISTNYLAQWRVPETDKVLWLKRKDKELGDRDVKIEVPNVEVRDWPTMDSKPTLGERLFYKSIALNNRTKRCLPLIQPLAGWLERCLGLHLFRKSMTCRGVQFVSQYKEIYTTRLHVMILSVLLGKRVHFIDNSYGKLSSFYKAWLSDCDGVDAFGQ